MLVLTAAWLMACSSGLGHLSSRADAGPGSGGASGTGGAVGADASAGSAGTAGNGGAAGSGGMAGSGGTAGAGGSDAGSTQPGLIVVSGVDQFGKPVLRGLDPWTGQAVATLPQKAVATAIAYDAAKNAWFVFQPTGAGGPAELTVVTFDAATKKFTPVTSAQVPAPIGSNAVAVLNNRILYISAIAQDGGPPVEGFTLLNTKFLASVSVLGSLQSVSFDPTRLALIGMNGWPGASTGGTVTVAAVELDTCSAGTCEIRLAAVTISLVGKASMSGFNKVATLPATNATAALTADRVSGSEADLLVRPPLSTGGSGEVLAFDHTNGFTPIGSPIPFAINGTQISGAAFDPCRNLVIATELDSARGIYVIPRDSSGTPMEKPLTTTLQGVYYEPYTHTVLQQYTDQNSFALNAYLLGGTNVVPSLSQRLSTGTLPWNPPPLDPRVVAVETPLQPVACN